MSLVATTQTRIPIEIGQISRPNPSQSRRPRLLARSAGVKRNGAESSGRS
jgi:hypothetical protein